MMGLNSSTAGVEKHTAPAHSQYCRVRSICHGERSMEFLSFFCCFSASCGGSCKSRLPTRQMGSVGSAAGRLLMPMLSDRIGRRPTDMLLFAVSLGLSAGFAFAQGWWVVACYAGLTFCYSGLAAVLPALSTDLFGFPHAGVNYGFLALGQSVGSLAFPAAANLWGLEAGRHWLAVGGAAAGFAAMWALKSAGQQPRRQDTGA